MINLKNIINEKNTEEYIKDILSDLNLNNIDINDNRILDSFSWTLIGMVLYNYINNSSNKQKNIYNNIKYFLKNHKSNRAIKSIKKLSDDIELIINNNNVSMKISWHIIEQRIAIKQAIQQQNWKKVYLHLNYLKKYIKNIKTIFKKK